MLSWWEIALRLLMAAVLGGVIGANRERREWAAGLRTHMLVSVGAALAIIVSAFGFTDILGTPNVILDPSRIAAQVVSGIGFLGAGTILFMQREQVVRGLTTAAGLWAVAAVGLAAGSGMYAAAGLATALIWIILAVVKPLERRLFLRNRLHPRVSLRLQGKGALAQVEAILREQRLPLFKFVLQPGSEEADELAVVFDRSVSAERLAAFVDALRNHAAVGAQRIEVVPRE